MIKLSPFVLSPMIFDMNKKAIFWFRQDLRVYDNRWLIKAIKEIWEVLPIFIIDKNITDDFLWLEDKKFWFIREALEELDKDIKKLSWESIKVFYDKPEDIIPKLMDKYDIDFLYANKSYWTYWKKRDEKILWLLNEKWKDFLLHDDFLLVEPENVEQRKVFTPFYKLWQKVIGVPEEIEAKKFRNIKIEENNKTSDFIKIEKHPYFTMDFWKIRFEEHIKKSYSEYRNDLDKDATSKLSPYIRFGIFSIRQLYNKAKYINSDFVSELAWREFWQHIDYYFPFTKKVEFQEKRRNIKWKHDEVLFEKWCNWETGYPVVDAAMKQLKETNWMHGRARMVVASFLTKDLLIDWRRWEKHFKKYLLDYDENVNFWNWQWSASVWADPKPLRIFNPCLQSEKFDPKAIFIEKYLPELKWKDLKSIHNPIDNKLDYKAIIVDHKEAQKIAREEYKK